MSRYNNAKFRADLIEWLVVCWLIVVGIGVLLKIIGVLPW